jgi:polysaccharide export outer membrane protein
MKKFTAIVISILITVICPAMPYCAQSTADITATQELKDNTRRKILEEAADKAHQKGEYIIGQGDILGVSVYGEGDMAISPVQGGAREKGGDDARNTGSGVQVRIDGKISLKHIGDVDAIGLTLTQLADYLKIIYATVFDDPVVTTILVQSNSQRYTVMGKVAKPGVYYLDYPINIVQAVARSGGFNEWANSDITLVRKETSKQDNLFKNNTLEFDYDDFLKGKKLERNILVQADDIIIVH